MSCSRGFFRAHPIPNPRPILTTIRGSSSALLSSLGFWLAAPLFLCWIQNATPSKVLCVCVCCLLCIVALCLFHFQLQPRERESKGKRVRARGASPCLSPCPGYAPILVAVNTPATRQLETASRLSRSRSQSQSPVPAFN